MVGFIKNILKFSVVSVVVPGIVFGAQQPNPRGSANVRNDAQSTDLVNSASVRRSATSVIARNAAANKRQSRAVVVARPGATRATSVRSVRPVTKGATIARTASKPSLARSGAKAKIAGGNTSRAGKARATALFNDVSKIGGGYAECRDSYATCMDQLCANANDTYRRCFCSDRFVGFRDTSEKLDEAVKLLAQFQDTNLDAVNKTAAEVNAMYTATAGEAAIKRDTSASQKLLDSISEVLAGKTKKTTKSTSIKQNNNNNSSSSLGVLDLSGLSASVSGDVFGGESSVFGGNSSSLFGSSSSSSSSSYTDISNLEGSELYDAALQQCSQITRDSCTGDAMFNLARSAYSILVTQDCNAYEKNITAKKASVEETVRTAEKYLREARLEEYRSHNSADINACLAEVESAILQPTACGTDYDKCLDYTGQYINATTGAPVYSQALFGLNNLIVLNGTADVLGANPQFNKWLDSKRIFAESALNNCSDISDVVWEEFKRSALIKISQAQDAKIQEIKDSCVSVIRNCYDEQTKELKQLDTTKTQDSTGTITSVAARGMCYDQVQACAALYGDPNGCAYDDSTKKLSNAKGKRCGLQALLAFVDTVDSMNASIGCEAVMNKHVDEICPDAEAIKIVSKDEPGAYLTKNAFGEDVYALKKTIPHGVCAGNQPAGYTCEKCGTKNKTQVRAELDNRMRIFCVNEMIQGDSSRTIGDERKDGTIVSAYSTDLLNSIIKRLYDEMGIAFSAGCEDLGGVWIAKSDVSAPDTGVLIQDFYKKYYGTVITGKTDQGKFLDEVLLGKNADETQKGWCVSAEVQKTCEEASGTLKEDGTCAFPETWLADQCVNKLYGTWTWDTGKGSGSCAIDGITQESVYGWESSPLTQGMTD